MGSLATKPATQHELAEATRQPSSGRPQPHSMATTTPVGAARSAAPPAATSIKGLWTTGKGKLLVYGKGKASSLHGKETFRHGKGTLGKWQGQRKVPRQILPVTARQACCSVDVNGPAVTRHVTTRGNFGQMERESLRRSTAREISATAKELWANGKGKGKFQSTARQACCCFRSVRSGGHTACDGKVRTNFVIYRRYSYR